MLFLTVESPPRVQPEPHPPFLPDPLPILNMNTVTTTTAAGLGLFSPNQQSGTYNQQYTTIGSKGNKILLNNPSEPEYDLLQSLAKERPVLVVLAGAHWTASASTPLALAPRSGSG